VRLAHHLLAYVAMLGRDRGRFLDCARRADESPLGSGALAATTFPLDREGVAKDLQLGGITRNSLDAVGDRDFAVELVSACALTQAHLSRLGEELVLWVAQEFRFVKLPEGYCSGSSLMPQKVNPDIPELVRAKTGRVNGDLVALLTVIKGLPLAYNKDLQETQEPLYDAVETVEASLGVMTGVVKGLQFDVERLKKAVGEGYLVATELADYLVTKGVPFRRAHDVAGALVRKALARGVELAELSLADMKDEAAEFEADVKDWLDPLRAVDRRDVPGGPARARIQAEIERLEKELGQ
jgi:argininosuccinate lyase